MNSIYIWLLVLGCLIVILYLNISTFQLSDEKFDIPVRSSSAWDWNIGPGYGAGYGTGYAMWGIWPESLPKEPWKNWMWGRRPLIFRTPYTPVPQIDYNYAPPLSKPISNYNVTLIGNRININGKETPILQLDRGRDYYFHVNLPNSAFIFTDGVKPLNRPISVGLLTVRFDETDPDILYYMIPHPASGNEPETIGIIYLNNI